MYLRTNNYFLQKAVSHNLQKKQAKKQTIKTVSFTLVFPPHSQIL